MAAKSDKTRQPKRTTRTTQHLDNLCEATNHPSVVRHGVELDSCLNDIDGAQSAVCDAAANAAREPALEEVHRVERSLRLRSHFSLACCCNYQFSVTQHPSVIIIISCGDRRSTPNRRGEQTAKKEKWTGTR